MLADFAGIAAAFLLLSFVILFPGYAAGWLLNPLQFRRREVWFQFAISVTLGIALGPVASYWIGRWLSLRAALVFYMALSGLAMVLLAARRPRFRALPVWGPLIIWCAWAIAALSDLQIGKRLYFSVMGLDYAIRTAFVSSISTFGLPAQNPFFYPGHSVPLRYHYFWLIQPALVRNAAPAVGDARQALIASAIWCGAGLVAIAALYLRFFPLDRNRKWAHQLKLTMGLLVVTGLNIVPALLCRTINVTFPFHREDQVDGWVYSTLWEPHYVAALIACLAGFLLISQPDGDWRRRALAGVLAGAAFASSAGCAIYIAFVFAIFMLTWSVAALVKRWYAELATMAISAVTAIVCLLPFLAELRGPASGGSFVHPAVRSFFIVELLAKIFHWNEWWRIPLANFLLLPLSYFLELGLFFAVALLEWRRLRRAQTLRRSDLALALMAISSLLVCTFLRSGVIGINDLGWHGSLLAQFVLLVRGAQLFPQKATAWLPLVVLGIAGTLYDQALVRMFTPLFPAHFLPKAPELSPDAKLGGRTYANRAAYEWLRAHSSASSIIQQNSNPILQDTFYGLYADRRTVAQDIQCTATFGGNPADCVPLQAALLPLFAANAPPNALNSACQALPIDYFIAKDTDAAWRSEASWVWQRTPVYKNLFVRIFRCRR